MAGPVGEAVPSTRVVVKAIERNGKNSLAGNRLPRISQMSPTE
jgi:hypothetical protein